MSSVRRLDHVGINVDDLDAATAFFLDLGLEREGEMSMRGELLDNVTGLEGAHTDVVFLRTPDGDQLELIKYHAPADDRGPEVAPANRLGMRHMAFVVDDLDDIVGRLRGKGIQTVGSVEDYENIYRLCYVRGPEGIIVELAEEIGQPR